MKAASYLNIIADQLHSYRAFVFPTANRIIQQYNAPCHKARIVLKWFEEHADEFHLFYCLGHLTRRILTRSTTSAMSWSGSSELKHHHVGISRLCVTAV
ncbi:hypothetical protein AVEN_181380-1 [Araneus ventricosus]|uniref:Tc1-like transposase DDE domain-containing protein n=1 Tax=Araneus ventricosus TaxID=182803 RepID=A0A4Y2UBN6_ARAVE|nr:hypothetical protein AVEN_181380-1 [Araneus ventricosus]